MFCNLKVHFVSVSRLYGTCNSDGSISSLSIRETCVRFYKQSHVWYSVEWFVVQFESIWNRAAFAIPVNPREVRGRQYLRSISTWKTVARSTNKYVHISVLGRYLTRKSDKQKQRVPDICCFADTCMLFAFHEWSTRQLKVLVSLRYDSRSR